MIAVTIEDAITGELLSMDGERVTLMSDRAYAPGARITARTAEGEAIRIKVHRSSQREGRFLVQGRAFDLRRELRVALSARLAPLE